MPRATPILALAANEGLNYAVVLGLTERIIRMGVAKQNAIIHQPKAPEQHDPFVNVYMPKVYTP